TGADATAQSFLHTGLHRVVNRRPGVSTETNRSGGWIRSHGRILCGRRIVSEANRIAVDAFEETAAFRADVADAEHEVACDFTLQLEAERIINRRMKIRRHLRAREDRRVHRKVLVRGERVGNVRQVERRHERERTPDVQGDVGVSIIVSASVTAANDELVATGEETHDPVVTGSWIPVEAKAWLEIVRITARNRIDAETRIVAGSSQHR